MTTNLTYEQAMERLDEIRPKGSIPGLEPLSTLLDKMGNPEKKLKYIHIAGTNGKGSVAAYLSEVLKEAGYRVGRYTSPSLIQYWERISIRGRQISKKDVEEGLSEIFSCFDEMAAQGLSTPTVFEVETALAFWYFAKKECNPVVIETGMGGRLDATNVIETPLIAVISSISMDHMDFLGNSIRKIALEKAGIIKKGCHVVSAWQCIEAKEVLKATCEQQGASFTIAEPDRISKQKSTLKGQTFSYPGYQNIQIHLLGAYQSQNAILALEAVNQLKECGYSLTEKQVYRGFANTEWFGRFTVLSDKPLLIVDGAHNEDAAKKLAETIRFYFTNRRIVFIMGVLRDKEYDKIIRQLCEFQSAVITVTPPIKERALQAYELAKEWIPYSENITAADSISEAVELSKLLAGPKGVVICFGSLSYLGEVKKTLSQEKKHN